MSAEAAARLGPAGLGENLADKNTADNLSQWKAALTELEDNLEAFTGGMEVSEQARELALGWQPPSNLGPLPAELMSRARLLAKAQKAAYRQLRGEASTIRRTAELVRGSSLSAAAVYLDVTG